MVKNTINISIFRPGSSFNDNGNASIVVNIRLPNVPISVTRIVIPYALKIVA